MRLKAHAFWRPLHWYRERSRTVVLLGVVPWETFESSEPESVPCSLWLLYTEKETGESWMIDIGKLDGRTLYTELDPLHYCWAQSALRLQAVLRMFCSDQKSYARSFAQLHPTCSAFRIGYYTITPPELFTETFAITWPRKKSWARFLS